MCWIFPRKILHIVLNIKNLQIIWFCISLTTIQQRRKISYVKYNISGKLIRVFDRLVFYFHSNRLK